MPIKPNDKPMILIKSKLLFFDIKYAIIYVKSGIVPIREAATILST